jgi:hypothetical protein
MPPGGLSKLRPLDSRHRQPIRIALFISLVTATSTRIQSEDVLHGAHVKDLPLPVLVPMKTFFPSAKALKLSLG